MKSNNWADLPLRIVSGALLLLVLLIGMWSGVAGILILLFMAAIAMHWEMGQMFGARRRRLFVICLVAGLGWLPLVVQPTVLNSSIFLPLIASFLPVVIGSALIGKQRGVYIIYGAILTLGTMAFWYITINFGVFGVTVLATLVILSDIGGYVAGRLIGGRKFWPSISPNKTWSGIFAGWFLATLFGYVLMQYGGVFWTIPVCVAVVIGAQFGDIAESWVKRRVGVKDSSRLIPGHGGVLDRLDGFIGGAVVLGLSAILFLS